jgi:hypothetical protein
MEQQQVQRVDRCLHGHAYTEDNTIYQMGRRGRVFRICRVCHNESSRVNAARRR